MKALKNNELEFVKGKDGKLTVHTKQYSGMKKDNYVRVNPSPSLMMSIHNTEPQKLRISSATRERFRSRNQRV